MSLTHRQRVHAGSFDVIVVSSLLLASIAAFAGLARMGYVRVTGANLSAAGPLLIFALVMLAFAWLLSWVLDVRWGDILRRQGGGSGGGSD